MPSDVRVLIEAKEEVQAPKENELTIGEKDVYLLMRVSVVAPIGYANLLQHLITESAVEEGVKVRYGEEDRKAEEGGMVVTRDYWFH